MFDCQPGGDPGLACSRINLHLQAGHMSKHKSEQTVDSLQSGMVSIVDFPGACWWARKTSR
jgi:hypothetical protein